MNGNENDWWDSPEEDEWVWFGGPEEADAKNRGRKLKSYAVQYKDDVIRSVEVDASSEKDAISQVLEEYAEYDNSSRDRDITVISVIEVGYDG